MSATITTVVAFTAADTKEIIEAEDAAEEVAEIMPTAII
jgi:hypothetical protein